MALSTSTNGSISSQINTQSPQASAPAGAGSPAAAPGRNVQPGTANNLLKGPGGGSEGIPLTSTILPVTNLSTATQATPAPPPQQQKTEPQQHPNAALLITVVALVVLAALALWRVRRSAKNTTQS